jgi:proteasome assembly chaperone (PAC2) family protein
MKEKLFTQIILLSIGSVVALGTFLMGSYFDGFMLKADYDKEKVTNVQVVTELRLGLHNVEKSNEEIKQILKEIKAEIRQKRKF